MISNQSLDRRAVACKGWRWMPGMRGIRIDGSTDRIMDESEAKLPNTDLLPDLSDPATLGCLLALVREAYAEPLGSVYYLTPMESKPGFYDEFGACDELHDTEAEALVAALEAAP